jgi:hypothetical protein
MFSMTESEAEAFQPGYIIDGGDPTPNAELKVGFTDTTPEDRLDALCDQMHLTESVRAAFRSDTISLFYTGFADDDKECQYDSVVDRITALWDFTTRCNEAYKDRTFIPPAPVAPLAPHRRHGGTRLSAKLSSSYEPRHIMSPRLEIIEAEVNNGLWIGDSTDQSLLRLQYLYCEATDPVWTDDEIDFLELSANDLASIYENNPPKELRLTELAAKKAEVHGFDLTQETLDARFQTFIGLINVDLSIAILKELRIYAATSVANNKKAVTMADTHKELLYSDDFLGKQKVLEALSVKFNDISQGSAGIHRKALKVLGAHARAMTTRSNEFLQFFTNIYTALGYELPSDLQHEEEVPDQVELAPKSAPQRAAEIATSKVVEVIEPEPTASPEVIESINNTRAQLAERVEEATAPWRLSRRRLKELQLDGLQGQLRAGARTEAVVEGMGDWTPLAPMTADRVALLLGTLVRVEEAGRKEGREGVLATLESARTTYNTLYNAIGILSAEASDEHHTQYIRPNYPHNPLESLQYVADNWHIFGQLLQTMAPHNFAGNVWQYLPEPRAHSRYATLIREYHSYNHNTVTLPADS